MPRDKSRQRHFSFSCSTGASGGVRHLCSADPPQRLEAGQSALHMSPRVTRKQDLTYSSAPSTIDPCHSHATGSYLNPKKCPPKGGHSKEMLSHSLIFHHELNVLPTLLNFEVFFCQFMVTSLEHSPLQKPAPLKQVFHLAHRGCPKVGNTTACLSVMDISVRLRRPSASPDILAVIKHHNLAFHVALTGANI